MKKSAYLPIAFAVAGKKLLLVGGGGVALRKFQRLVGRGAQITLVSPEILPTLLRLAEQNGCTLRRRRFRVADLVGQDLVFAATDNAELNARIVTLCRQQRLFCNVATGGEQDFHLMGAVERGDLVLGVSTGGTAPFLARTIRRFLAATFDRSWSGRLKRLQRLRSENLGGGRQSELRRLSAKTLNSLKQL